MSTDCWCRPQVLREIRGWLAPSTGDGTVRLIGLMVVRDAADLLEINLRHHLLEGVERFLVLDHQSVDETPRILERFAAAGVVEWERVEGPFCMEGWLNELALTAYLQGADWVLPIDADELWTAGEGRRLSATVASTGADVIEARVLNFVQERDQLRSEPGSLLRMIRRVEPVVPQVAGLRRFLDGTLPLVAVECPVKCISRADPTLWIRRGNHEVRHPGVRERRSDIACLHAPLRSRASLAERRDRTESLGDPLLAPGDSWHWRRWSSIVDEAGVDAEWRANSVAAGALGASDVPLVIDRRLAELARRALACTGAAVEGPAAERATRRGSATRGALVSVRSALAARANDELLEARFRAEREVCERELTRLRAGLAAAHHGRLVREAEVSARLEVLAAIESSRAHRLWQASIRARRTVRSLPAALAAAARSRRGGWSRRKVREFRSEGFLAPIRVFDAGEAKRIAEALRADPPADGEWGKDCAVTSRRMYELAANEALVRGLEALLGDEVMLWGASVIVRAPGDVHPWHTDIESSAPEGQTVSVWIGLENVSRESSLAVVSRSHRFGEPFQKVARSHDRRRGESTDREVETWARERDPRSRILQLDTKEGEAVFFDGRLWHGSRHIGDRTRVAVLLQYATPRTPIRRLDPAVLDWPFRLLDKPRPRCILVSGSAAIDPAPVNRLVASPPPDPIELPPLHNSVGRTLGSTVGRLAPDRRRGWRAVSLVSGSTPNVESLSCHVSVLSPGCCPHPPHRHPEEELLVVLEGAAEIVLADEAGAEVVTPASPGVVCYHSAHQLHTIRTSYGAPATYLVLRFKGRGSASAVLPPLLHGYAAQRSSAEADAARRGFAARTVFEGATRDLGLLHCHCSAVAPDAGYAPHVDEHDVVLVVLSGTIETAQARVEGPGVVVIPAGVEHGLENPGSTIASYLAVELHRAAPRRTPLVPGRDDPAHAGTEAASAPVALAEASA